MIILKKELYVFVLGLAFFLGFGVGMPEEQRKEIQITVSEGSTLWQECQKYVSEKDDINYVVWEACKNNNIKNPGNIQPGTKIKIYVKEKTK